MIKHCWSRPDNFRTPQNHHRIQSTSYQLEKEQHRLVGMHEGALNWEIRRSSYMVTGILWLHAPNYIPKIDLDEHSYTYKFNQYQLTTRQFSKSTAYKTALYKYYKVYIHSWQRYLSTYIYILHGWNVLLYTYYIWNNNWFCCILHSRQDQFTG